MTGALEEPLTESCAGVDEGDDELPSVSVVVPVLDAASEIGRLLDSLLGLDYPRPRVQIIVVDNGSTDGTPGVVSAFPVMLLSETRTRSSYAARNRGAAAASGEWVAFTDADCVASPDWLRRLLAPGISGETGAVAGEILSLESRTPVQRLTERFGIVKHAVTMPHKALPCFSTANVAVRRAVLQDLGGFRDDVRYFADMELSWRMQIVARSRILFRPDAVVRHRHRRTLRALWRQGIQHGRGVAFMKRAYPGQYRIRGSEQAGRIRLLARSLAEVLMGGSGEFAGPVDRIEGRRDEAPGVHSSMETPSGPGVHQSTESPRHGGTSGPLRNRVASQAVAPAVDRFYAPLFLALWYGGMAAGYMMGPAWSRREHERGSAPRDRGRGKGDQ